MLRLTEEGRIAARSAIWRCDSLMVVFSISAIAGVATLTCVFRASLLQMHTRVWFICLGSCSWSRLSCLHGSHSYFSFPLLVFLLYLLSWLLLHARCIVHILGIMYYFSLLGLLLSFVELHTYMISSRSIAFIPLQHLLRLLNPHTNSRSGFSATLAQVDMVERVLAGHS